MVGIGQIGFRICHNAPNAALEHDDLSMSDKTRILVERDSPMRALRVLVVEDDAMIAVLLVELLTGMGHDVCAIEATEAGAVATAVRCRPDLMIVNSQLGDGSGISAVGEIHRTCFVPLVFVSGDISGVRAFMPDAVAIQKPFRELDLARAIQRALLQDGQGHLTTVVPFIGIDGQPTRAIE